VVYYLSVVWLLSIILQAEFSEAVCRGKGYCLLSSPQVQDLCLHI